MNRKQLILLPGTLCDERLWEHQIYGLGNIADVTVMDLTNHDSIEKLAVDVLSKTPQYFFLAGLSLGGIVALEIMRLAPDRVKGLALLSTNPFPPKTEQKQIWNKFIAMAENGEFLDIAKKYLLPVLIDEDNRTDEKEEIILEMAMNVGPQGYINQLKSVMNRDDQTPILATITCPSIVMVGDRDAVCPVPFTDYMENAIPDAMKVIVSNAGHLVTLEQPGMVTEVMRNWFISL